MVRSVSQDVAAADDILLTCEEILAGLDAAEDQLRALAAQCLSYAAVARIHRRSTARARVLLAGHRIEPIDRLVALREPATAWDTRDPDTEELLHAAVRPAVAEAALAPTHQPAQGPQASSTSDVLDDGPEGAADVMQPIATDENVVADVLADAAPAEDGLAGGATAGAPAPTDVLVEIDDDVTDATLDADEELTDERRQELELRALIGDDTVQRIEPAPSASAYVSYDDAPAGNSPSADNYDALVSFDDAAPPDESTGDEPLVQFSDDGSLVQFDDAGEAEPTLAPEEFEEITAVRAPGDRRAGGQVEEFDLMPDPTGEKHPEENVIRVDHGGAPAARAAAAEDDEDMSMFAEETADDASSTHEVIVSRDTAQSKPTMAITRQPTDPGPRQPRDRTTRIDDTPTTPRVAPPTAAAARPRGGNPLPTIRDATEPRPRAAAIQLGPQVRVLGGEEEEEALEMDAAENDSDIPTGEGLRIDIEEYEDADEDEVADEAPSAEVEMEDDAAQVPTGLSRPQPIADPGQIRALLERAQEAVRAGEIEAGVNLFSDVLDADGDNVEAHIGRGRLYLDLGDFARAMSDFTVAEDLAPNSPEPQIAVGDLYFARKDYRKAIDYFNAALEMSPNHAMAFCRRGISHYYRKNYQEAVDDLLKAQKLDPDIPNIQTFVSMAKKKLGPAPLKR